MLLKGISVQALRTGPGGGSEVGQLDLGRVCVCEVFFVFKKNISSFFFLFLSYFLIQKMKQICSYLFYQ